MKIVFFTTRISFGGGERIIRTLIEDFIRRGVETCCVTWNESLIGQPFPCEIKLLGKEHRQGIIPRQLNKFISAARTLKELKPDYVVSFGNEPYITAACYLQNIKLLYSLRVDPMVTSGSLLQRLNLPFMLKTASNIVFQTEAVRDYYKDEIRKKATVIPNPIMDELPAPIKERVHKISAIGRMMPQKNFDLLLDAAHLCNLKDFKIHFYGTGELEEHLREKVNRYGMQDKVVFEGFVSKVVEHIKDSSIFVLSSDWEGMPNALIEAMAMGVACIATDVATGGSRFLIQDGENGLLIPVGDKEALAWALQRLIDDECLRTRMGEQAINVRKRLEKEAIIDQWLRLLES